MEKLKKPGRSPEFTSSSGLDAETVLPRPTCLRNRRLTYADPGDVVQGFGIQEAPYVDPMATLKNSWAGGFSLGPGWSFYRGYRATGDKRILESLRVSARHYRDLCNEYPDVAQAKARDPEHMTFMSTMAISARLTLQLARKDALIRSAQEEIAEAETFLKAVVATLKPICEGNSDLDPEMGIPKDWQMISEIGPINRAQQRDRYVCHDATAALEDLQAIQEVNRVSATD
jgi:hypothetical protein